jgi:hypothetical protein
LFLAICQTSPRPLPIERTAADTRENKRGRVGHTLTRPPKTDKRLLDDIFGIGPAVDELAGEEHECRSMPIKPGLPVVGRGHVGLVKSS